MGLTKINGFTGEAEVQGALRGVQYQGSALTIHGLTLDEAYGLLDALAAKSIAAVRVRGKEKEPAPESAPTAGGPARVARDGASEGDAKAAQVLPPAAEKEPAPPEKPEALLVAGVVPEAIAKSGRFIEVMDWVIKSKGLKRTQVDEIVAECEKLKDLPIIRRVRDIRDKVVSNLAAYGEAGDAA